MATTDTCVNIIYSEPIIPRDQDHPITTSPTIIHVSTFQHRSTPWSVCGEPWSRFGQFWRDLVKTWSNLWSSTCIRFLTVAVDPTIREKTVTEVGWLSRSRAMLQMTDSAGSTNSRFYLDKTQRENIVGCGDKTVAWVLAKHGLAFGKTQLWPTHNVV